MPSPFPGMDPYLEAQGLWEGFHAMLITYCAESLNVDLPETYVAQVETRVALIAHDIPSSERIPDVVVGRVFEATSSTLSGSSLATTTLEPTTIPLAKREVEVHERWIEIARLPDLELVTVIEILSPTNKSGTGRSDYLAKRDSLIDQPVNLVEIDLLLSGNRMPMGRRLPPGDYFTVVARPEHRPDADVFSWSIRSPLPRLPIPLRAPDPDIIFDLGDAIGKAYDRGKFHRLIRYGHTFPATFPVSPDDRAWAEGVLQ